MSQAIPGNNDKLALIAVSNSSLRKMSSKEKGKMFKLVLQINVKRRLVYQLRVKQENEEKRFAIAVEIKKPTNLKPSEAQTSKANTRLKQKAQLRSAKR